MRTAQRENCDFVSHGCTGKGNDQVRFELAFYTIQPSIKIIAPWRDPKFFNRFAGRNDLIDYAEKTGIPVTSKKSKPWSMDANLAHISYEAGMLEDPDQTPESDMWLMTGDPLKAPNEPMAVTIQFEKGIPVKVDTPQGAISGAVELFTKLNELGSKYGIGRIDVVENRFIGLKSRGCYESPAMAILRAAHLNLEGLVMDKEVRKLRDRLVTTYWSEFLYDGKYFSPEREFVENSLLFSQRRVNGLVRLQLMKGAVGVLGRSSATEKLYSEEEASMDSLQNFSPEDTTGFIGIQSIRLVELQVDNLQLKTDTRQAEEVWFAKGRRRRESKQGLTCLAKAHNSLKGCGFSEVSYGGARIALSSISRLALMHRGMNALPTGQIVLFDLRYLWIPCGGSSAEAWSTSVEAESDSTERGRLGPKSGKTSNQRRNARLSVMPPSATNPGLLSVSKFSRQA